MQSTYQESVAGVACSGSGTATENRLSIILSCNDLDRVWAALILAVGAASSGMAVSMFFAFWGLCVLRRRNGNGHNGNGHKSLRERMFGLMLPRGTGDLHLSKMNMGGCGPALFRHVAREKHVLCPDELLDTARDLGVRFIACQMSMDMMGLKQEDMMDGVVYGGVATCLADSCKSKATLFI